MTGIGHGRDNPRRLGHASHSIDATSMRYVHILERWVFIEIIVVVIALIFRICGSEFSMLGIN
jgi:hypothetical protein